MKHTTITQDSIDNVNDMVADGLYEDVDHFIEETFQTLGAGHFEGKWPSLNILNLEVNEDTGLIEAEIEYDDLDDLKEWMRRTSPELTDEDIEELLAA